MRTHKTAALVLALACLAPVFALGANLCEDTENYRTCSFRLANGAKAEATKAATTAVTAMNTGDNEQSTTNDFLPLLRLLLNDDGNSDENRKIGFEWAPHLSKTLPSKLTVTLQDSELYAPLDKALRAAGLEDQVDPLGKKIDAGDDVVVAFTLSKASTRYGRDPELHTDLLGELVSDEGQASLEYRTAKVEFGRFRTEHIEITQETSFNSIEDAAVRARYRDVAEKFIALNVEYLKAYAARLKKIGFYGLLDLIDNQPQLTLSVGYESRGDVVGPDDLKVTFGYEFGGRNVNTFRAYSRKNCGDGGIDSEVTCLQDYLEDGETLAESFRVKLGAEYSKLQRYEFELATPAFSYVEKPVEHLSFSATVSRQLGAGQNGLPRPRFDAKISYEDFSDDPSRQDRGIATVTFSYPVAQGFFVTLGAIYATRPEFRGSVDKEVSTRLGFTYKLVENK
jgi:hypothetical protein